MSREIIPYGRHYIDQDDIDAVVDVLKSDYLTQGTLTSQFEDKIKEYSSSKFSCTFNSATSALHAACIAINIRRGDMVWTTPISFVATANCALYCDAKVKFIDIEKKTRNIDIERLREELVIAEKNNSLPMCLIVVHFAGYPNDMKAIKSLQEIYKFKIIEDASHALGASIEDNKIGSCKYSDITVFSFHPVKMITTGEGGMTTTNNRILAKRLKLIREHGIDRYQANRKDKDREEIWNYEQLMLGYNYRMNDISAALGISQLKKLDFWIERRNKIAQIYIDEFKSLPIINQGMPNNGQHSWHIFTVEIEDKSTRSQKEAWQLYRDNGILVNLHYIPIYFHKYYQVRGYKRGLCPNAECYYSKGLTIPLYPTMTENQINQVVVTTKEIFR